MSGISQETWAHQKHLAENSLALTGRLPDDGQPGSRFWDMVREHYLQDVRTTGNDHRFLSNHCPFVDYWVPREFIPKPAPAPMPALPPVIWIPVPPMPFQPPIVVLPAPLPIPPPSHPGYPGTSEPTPSPVTGTTVPEPDGFILASIGIAICFVGTYLRHRRS